MSGLLYISVRKTFGPTVALESLDLEVQVKERRRLEERERPLVRMRHEAQARVP